MRELKSQGKFPDVKGQIIWISGVKMATNSNRRNAVWEREMEQDKSLNLCYKELGIPHTITEALKSVSLTVTGQHTIGPL